MAAHLTSNQKERVRFPHTAPISKQDIAQSGSALALEVSGRWFKSNYPDQFAS